MARIDNVKLEGKKVNEVKVSGRSVDDQPKRWLEVGTKFISDVKAHVQLTVYEKNPGLNPDTICISSETVTIQLNWFERFVAFDSLPDKIEREIKVLRRLYVKNEQRRLKIERMQTEVRTFELPPFERPEPPKAQPYLRGPETTVDGRDDE